MPAFGLKIARLFARLGRRLLTALEIGKSGCGQFFKSLQAYKFNGFPIPLVMLITVSVSSDSHEPFRFWPRLF